VPVVYVKYTCQTVVMTGKFDETIETNEKTIGGLLSELNRNYPGFKDIFITPEHGILNLRTMITIKRVGVTPFGVFDPNTEIRNGDKILFW